MFARPPHWARRLQTSSSAFGTHDGHEVGERLAAASLRAEDQIGPPVDRRDRARLQRIWFGDALHLIERASIISINVEGVKAGVGGGGAGDVGGDYFWWLWSCGALLVARAAPQRWRGRMMTSCLSIVHANAVMFEVSISAPRIALARRTADKRERLVGQRLGCQRPAQTSPHASYMARAASRLFLSTAHSPATWFG